MFISVKRIIHSGWSNFRRQTALSFATVSIMVMTIFLITSLFLFQGTTSFLISILEERVDISVYFKKDVLEDDILRVKEELSQGPEVKNVEYISREEALARFIEKHKKDPVILESLAEVGANPFSASLNIKAFQASQYEAISNFFKQDLYRELVEKIDYYQNKQIIDRIFKISTSVKFAGFLLGLILGLIAVLVAFNTIRLAIYSSREEISIMRLVGASNWFIRGPFIVQGIIVGVLSTLLTLIIFFVILFFANGKVEAFLPDFSPLGYFLNNFFIILFIQLTAGIGLGIISSFIAIRKYLKI